MKRVQYSFSRIEAKEIIKNTETIFELLKEEALQFRDAISKQYPKDKPNKFNSRSLAKVFLMTNMQLSGQTLAATRQGFTTLASHGVRALVENEINAKYIFAHKDNRVDSNRVEKLASQFLATTRFRSRIKSRFDGTSLRQRAKSVRKLTLYKQHYAELSGYGHSLGVVIALNDEQRFLNKSVEYSIASVSRFSNIMEYVSEMFDFKRNEDTQNKLKELVNSWNEKHKST